MKILFIAPRFHTNQLGLIQKLIEEKHEVEFFVVGKGISESYKHITPRVIPVSWITKWYVKNFRKDIAFPDYAKIAIPKIFQYWKMIYSFKPDVMVLREGSVMMYSWFAIPLAIFLRIRIVFYTQGPKFVDRVSLIRRLHDLFFIKIIGIRWFTPVLYRGGALKGKIELGYIDFVPFFIYPQRLLPNYDLKEGVINFLCVAKYEKRKNLTLLINTFAKLTERYNNFKLTIIGSTGNQEREDNYKEIVGLIESHNLLDRIEALKNIPHEHMTGYFLQHHVLILPSVKESASVSQIEAMSCGLAVICSFDNGTAHYIQNNVNGFLVRANLDELCSQISIYLDDPGLALLHGRNSIKLVNSELSVDNSYFRLMKVFKD